MTFQYKWRVRARVIAYLSLIITICVALLYSIFYISIFTKSLSEDSILLQLDLDFYGFKIYPEEDAPWTIYLRAALEAFSTVISLWTGILLLKATKAEAEPVHAIWLTKIWIFVTITGFLLYTFGWMYNVILFTPREGFYLLEDIATFIIDMVFTAVILFIVLKFARELKQAAQGEMRQLL